jgi:hypothetical protein
VSLLATQQDFEPANATEGKSSLYYQPADGTGYKIDFPTFTNRINTFKGRVAPNNQKLAVWGCGWGSLVNLAVQAGYDAYGFDASSYAITRGKALLPAIATRLFVRSALVAADVTASRSDAGIHGGTRFSLLVTEDLLTCMSDAEIAVTLPLLRASCSTNLLHMVTPVDPWAQANGLNDQRINWKTDSQWKALLNPPDSVYDCPANLVVAV